MDNEYNRSMRFRWVINLPAAILIALLAALLRPAALDFIRADDEFSLLEARLTLDPADAASHYRMGLLLAASEPDEALDHLDFAAASDDENAVHAHELARVIRAARLEGSPSYSLASVGQELATLGEWQLAANALERALHFAPKYAEAWAYLGEARQQLGGDGYEELQEALEASPSSLAANLFMGLYWQRQGDFEQAESYFQHSLELEPGNPAVYIQLGWNTVLAGDVPGARDYFYAARDAAPDDVETWKALGQYSADNEIYIEETGLIAAYRALQMAPKDPEAMVLMGRILFLLEDTEQAIEHYLAAVEIAPSYAGAHLHLGLAYLVEGRRREALEQFEAARALDPEGADGRFAAQLVRNYGP